MRAADRNRDAPGHQSFAPPLAIAARPHLGAGALRMSRRLEVTAAALSFQNPVLLASGTAAFGREIAGVIALDELGGIVTKAVSRLPRQGAPAPRVAEFPGGMINAVGLANPGLEEVRRTELPWLAANVKRARVLVNVVGDVVEDYAAVVAGLDAAEGVDGF